MTLNDDDLLDFDYKVLANPRAGRVLLEQHGDPYRYQLVIARHLDGWADRNEKGFPGTDKQFTDGFALALQEVAAHLRQGDYLPGGILYDQTIGDEPPGATD